MKKERMRNMMTKALIIGATAIALLAKPAPQLYIDQFIVTGIEGNDIILADEGDDEFIWIAETGETWKTDDYAVGIMNDNGTPDDVTDDEIVELRNLGHYVKRGVVSIY
jgi:hypothetical protein